MSFNIRDGILVKYTGNETEVFIPNGVTSIRNCAFQGCIGLTRVEFPNSVATIGNYAFDGCINLAEVVIPNSVTRMCILTGAFINCTGLTRIEFSNSVAKVGTGIFRSCTSLAEAIVPGHFINLQIVNLGLPRNCVIERRELSILPKTTGYLSSYRALVMKSGSEVDQLAFRAFAFFAKCSFIMHMRDELPRLPEEIWLRIASKCRTVYRPAKLIDLNHAETEAEFQEQEKILTL